MFTDPDLETVGPYRLQKIIGSGTTGTVRLATHSQTGAAVALKIISKSSFEQKPDLQVRVRREIALMQIVNHPNILRLLDVYESPNHLHMVLEYAEHGELFDFLVARRSLSERVALDFFRQITLGLEYLHSHGICHRDLKPENILLDRTNRVKIADFGFARWVRRDVTDPPCGSPHYAAPEVFSEMPYDGRRADIWSLGVILFALLAGYLPFDAPSMLHLIEKVKVGCFEMPPFDDDLSDLIRSMLSVDPLMRPSITEIKSSPVFTRGLPPAYRLPQPLPLSAIPLLQNPATIPPWVLTVVRHIGYDDEELRADLSEDSVSMAKVFVAMLTARQCSAQIPWNGGAAPDAGVLAGPPFMAPAAGASPDRADPFRRRVQRPVALTVRSVADRPEWCVDPDPGLELAEEVIVAGLPLCDVVACAQRAAGEAGLEFLHPDPETLFCRSDELVATVCTTVSSEDRVVVGAVLHHGRVELFKEFTMRMAELLKQEADAEST
jgi:BR serine/threonine kinase